MVKNSRIWCLAAVLVTVLTAMPSAAQRLKRYHSRPEARGIVFLTNVEKGIYKLTNDVRRKNGLPALTNERALCGIARKHSEDMLTRKYFSHVDPDGKAPHERIIRDYPYPLQATGENIYGCDGSEPLETDLLARIMVDSWMSSPGHRQNILNPAFTDIGIGVAAFGKQIRATQVFGQIKNR